MKSASFFFDKSIGAWKTPKQIFDQFKEDLFWLKFFGRAAVKFQIKRLVL